MDKCDWDKLISEKFKVPNFDIKRFQFYERFDKFLKDNQNKIQVNVGGMGLGKTFCSCAAFKDNNNFTTIFIATPFATIKNEWAKELNRLYLDYIVWMGKDECIKPYHKNVDDCSDDCDHIYPLYHNREFQDLCYSLLGKLEFPITAADYYSKNGIEFCLRPMIRLGLLTKKIIVGDYFGFLNPKVWNLLVKRRRSLIVIDEAHLLPNRAINFLSRTIDLKMTAKKLEEELNINIVRESIEMHRYSQTIDLLNRICKYLINSLSKLDDKEELLSIDRFKEIWDNIIITELTDAFSYSQFILRLDELSKHIQKANKDDDEEYEEKTITKFLNFLEFWESHSYDINYSPFFSYAKNTKNHVDRLEINVVCNNPSDYLSDLWSNYEKICLISGTIENQEYYSQILGLNNFNHIYERKLDSYSIRKNVLIYPFGDFTQKNGNRLKTIKEQSKTINDVLKMLDGRTILYTLSKEMSFQLQQILDKELNIINFSRNENNEDKNKEEYEISKELFNASEKSVGLMHITGIVEGQNFLDENGDTVDNLIILGYPFAMPDLEYRMKIDYWTNKLRNAKKAKEFVQYYPVSSKIYQACFRAKRKEGDTPLIILWGNIFGRNMLGYQYLNDDLKGDIIEHPDNLLLSIEDKIKQVKNGIGS